MCEVDVIVVVAATKDRQDKLLRMVCSVPDEIPIYLYGTSPDDFIGSEELIEYMEYGNLSVIQANNHLIKKVLMDYPDASVVVTCDDVEFEDGCFDVIQQAVDMSTDFLYGLTCKNMTCKDDAFCCIGNKILIEENGSPYCEDYLHFYADTELGNKLKNVINSLIEKAQNDVISAKTGTELYLARGYLQSILNIKRALLDLPKLKSNQINSIINKMEDRKND